MDELHDIDRLEIGGMNIDNKQYTDDAVLVADTGEKLQALVIALRRKCDRRKVKINAGRGKTKIMSLTKINEQLDVRIMFEGKLVPQVESYEYLGRKMTTDGKSEGEIMRWYSKTHLYENEEYFDKYEHEYEYQN